MAMRDKVYRGRCGRAGVNACATAWIDQFSPGLCENFDVTFFPRVLLDLLGTELQIKMHPRCDALALSKSALQDFCIHVHVGHLAAGAAPAIGGVDAHFFSQLVD